MFTVSGAAEIQATKKSEAHSMYDANNIGSESGLTFAEIPTYLKDLITNPTLVFQTLFQTCELLLISGFTAFGPKYIESQFSASSAVAGMYWGKCNTLPIYFNIIWFLRE